jgi:hypothetical protein
MKNCDCDNCQDRNKREFWKIIISAYSPKEMDRASELSTWADQVLKERVKND